MDAAHFHLMLNHVPIVGTVFGTLLLGAALLRKSQELLKASLVMFVVCAAVAVPVYLTGEPAEHLVEHLPGVTEPVIEAHEEAAESAFVAILVLGIAALAALVVFRGPKDIPRWCGFASLAVALAACGLMLRTANLGGKIRHTEIRNNPSAANINMDADHLEKSEK